MHDPIPEKTRAGFDDRKAEFIEYLLARGSSLSAACDAAKCAPSTYHAWWNRHPERMDQIRREAGEAASIQWIALKARRTMLELLDDPDASPTVRRQVAEWVLSRADDQLRTVPQGPQVDARQIHISTEALESLSLEELDAIEANPDLILDSHADE